MLTANDPKCSPLSRRRVYGETPRLSEFHGKPSNVKEAISTKAFIKNDFMGSMAI